MHVPVSKKNAVFLGFFMVEIILLLGDHPQGLWFLGIRISVILASLALVVWEFLRSGRTRGPEAIPPGSMGDGEELAILYHEIRNCTSTLKGNAILLKLQMTSEAERAPVERIERVAASIDRIAREVMDLADPGRVQPMVRVDLPRLIAECAEDHFPGRSGAFSLRCPADLPEIAGDPGKLRQVFVNLFKNSLEADAGSIAIHAEHAGGKVRISIEDDGTGCPAGDLRKIFFPMYTSKNDKGGMGIGLALVKAIVEAHGGTIRAAAPKGSGARGLAMHLTLPVNAFPAPIPGHMDRRTEALPV